MGPTPKLDRKFIRAWLLIRFRGQGKGQARMNPTSLWMVGMPTEIAKYPKCRTRWFRLYPVVWEKIQSFVLCNENIINVYFVKIKNGGE